MVRIGYLVVTLSVFAIVASAQEDPLAWFPLQVGSRRVYEHEWKSGDRNRPDVDRWRTEQTITGWVTIPEGIVVLRDVKQLGSSPQRTERVIKPDGQIGFVQEPDYNRDNRTAGDREPYLVRGNCLYVISGGWDIQTRQLRPQYRKYLIEGAVSPDFCFPLRAGQEWGNPHGYTVWRVEPARDNVGSFLPSQYAGAIHILSDNIGGGPVHRETSGFKKESASWVNITSTTGPMMSTPRSSSRLLVSIPE
jgi:hypothetical protein